MMVIKRTVRPLTVVLGAAWLCGVLSSLATAQSDAPITAVVAEVKAVSANGAAVVPAGGASASTDTATANNATTDNAMVAQAATAQVASEEEQAQLAFVAGWPAYRDSLRAHALAAGISPTTVDAVFADLTLIPRVVNHDRSQPHKVMRHEEYLLKVINEQRIRMAREKFREHAALLAELEAKYGVDGKFIIALWGVESSFGRLTGKHHVPSALATMAYEGRRREFFQKEFVASLRIIEQGHITNEAMRGSWAGAMGQCQFMPSSFLHFAADGDGDGHHDIWSNSADVLASIANYLHKNGWRRGETWGRQVRLTQTLDLSAAQLKDARALAEWQELGVRRDTGADLPARAMKAKLLLPDSEWERAYLVYHNYEVLLRWNRSRHFATSVGYLAERIGFPPVSAAADEPVPAANATTQSDQQARNGGNDQAQTEAP